MIICGCRVAEARPGIDYVAGKEPRRAAYAGSGHSAWSTRCKTADQAEATVRNKSRRYSFEVLRLGRLLNVEPLRAAK